jgi:tetratricopeptide (TPR) repeat protein
MSMANGGDIGDRVLQLSNLAREAEGGLASLDPGPWARRLEESYSELEASLRWLIDPQRHDDALQLCISLVDFWMSTGRIDEGRAWFDRALAVTTQDGSVRARALFHAGLLAFWQGDDAAAESLHQAALEMGRRLGDRSAVAIALTGLARIALRTDAARSRSLSQEALDALMDGDDPIGLSNALHVLGVAAQMQGDLEAARRFMSERLDLAHQAGNQRQIAAEAANLSMVEMELGELGRSWELSMEAVGITRARGDTWMIPYNLNGLAALAVRAGDPQRASTLLAVASRLVEEQGASWPPDEAPRFERSRSAAAKALGPGAFERAWASGRSLALDAALTVATAGVEAEG